MKKNFGPWTTAINTGNNPQLSTFWKRRMAMLVTVNQARAVLTGRSLTWLLVLACLLGALPTVHTETTGAHEKQQSPVARQSKPGRIFLEVTLRLDRTGNNQQVIRQIIAVDPETGLWEKMTGPGNHPRVSPDGRRIAFERDETIWTCDTKGSDDAGQIAEVNGRPVWSPDGKQILCGNVTRVEQEDPPNGPWQYVTWRFAHDGTGKQIKTEIPTTDLVWDWSPDGNWIVSTSLRDRPKGMGWQLYLMKPDGSRPRYLTRWGVNFTPRFSPDGRSIVYTDSSRSKERIKIVDVEGKNTREVFQAKGLMGLKGVCWSPDGKRLAAVVFDWHLDENGRKTFGGASEVDPNFRLLIMDADGKNPRELRIQLDAGTQLTWMDQSPDWR